VFGQCIALDTDLPANSKHSSTNMMTLRDLLEQLEQIKPECANDISPLLRVVDVDSGAGPWLCLLSPD
jgi:hypothetical protein